MGNNDGYLHIHSIKDIGTFIRKRRKEAGLTIHQLADLLGVSPRFIGELERGRETVSAGKLLSVISALGIDCYVKFRP